MKLKYQAAFMLKIYNDLLILRQLEATSKHKYFKFEQTRTNV